MAIKVGINGFGRIGRVVLRIMMERPETFDICGINLRKADVDYMVYMIKYDSVFRQFIGTVEREDQNLIVNGHKIRVFSEADAAMIPWHECGAEYIIESTGANNNTEKASRHFKGGAKKVIITAPAKDEATPTFVMGVNEADYDRIEQGDDLVIANIRNIVENGGKIIVEDKTKGFSFEVKCELSERGKGMMLAGGLLNYTKANG